MSCVPYGANTTRCWQCFTSGMYCLRARVRLHVPRCARMPADVRNCSRMLATVQRCAKTCADVLACARMYTDARGCAQATVSITVRTSDGHNRAVHLNTSAYICAIYRVCWRTTSCNNTYARIVNLASAMRTGSCSKPCLICAQSHDERAPCAAFASSGGSAAAAGDAAAAAAATAAGYAAGRPRHATLVIRRGTGSAGGTAAAATAAAAGAGAHG